MKKNLLLSFLCVVFFVFTFTTCTVGLGTEVDITVPTISIDYPENASIMRGDFVVSGAADDDTAVESISVTLISEDKSVTHTLPGVFDAAKKEWKVSFANVKEEGKPWKWADGEYTVRASVTDAAGRTNTVEKIYYIDNTMPFVMLDRPSTKGSDLVPDPYGSDLVFSGTLYDAHDCQKIVIDFFVESNGELQQIPEAQFEALNINQNWEIALSGEGVTKDVVQVLSSYIPQDRLYEPCTFYYSLTAYDSAYEYKGAGNTDSIGNKTTHYYLYDDVALMLDIGKKLPSRSILSKFDSGIDNGGSETSRGELASVGITEEEMKEKRISSVDITFGGASGTFSISPYNKNPTVEISGITWYEKTQREEKAFVSNEIPGNSTVAVTLKPGPDGTTILPDSVYIYMTDTLPETLDELDEKYKIDAKNINKSGVNYIINYQLPASRNPTGGKGWYIIVDACDQMGYTTTRRDENSASTRNVGYGIFAVTLNGAAPYFTGSKIEPESKKVRPNSEHLQEFVVTACDADSENIELYYKPSDETEYALVPVTSVAAAETSDEPYEFTFKFELPVSEVHGGVVSYDFYLTDGTYQSSITETRQLTTDKKVPEIKSMKEPLVATTEDEEVVFDFTAGGYTNTILTKVPTVTFEGTADEDLATALFYATPNRGDNTYKPTTGLSDITKWSVATKSGLDNADKTFEITMELKNEAGDTAEGNYVIWYALSDDTGAYSEVKKLADVVMDLESPVLRLQGVTPYKTDIYTISADISDTNGLKSLEFYVNDGLPIVTDLTGKASYSWSYSEGSEDTENSLKDGEYKYKIKVVDIADRVTEESFVIFVDRVAPTASSNLDDVEWITGDSYEVKITADDVAVDGVKSGLNRVEYSLDNGSTWAVAGKVGTTYRVELSGDVMEDGSDKPFKYRAIDEAGNKTEDITVTFGVDHIPPVFENYKLDDTLVSDIKEGTQQDGSIVVTRTNAFTISGKLTDASSGIKSFNFYENGAKTDVPLATDGTWSYTKGRENGNYRYEISAEDNAGNSTSLTVVKVVINNNLPEIYFQKINNDEHNGRSTVNVKEDFYIRGIIKSGQNVKEAGYKLCYSDGTTDESYTLVTPVNNNDGSYSWESLISVSKFTEPTEITGIYLMVEDVANQRVEESAASTMSVIYDIEKPIIANPVYADGAITVVEDKNWVKNTVLSLANLTVTDAGSGVSVVSYKAGQTKDENGVVATSEGSLQLKEGKWFGSIVLQEGENFIQFVAEDMADNTTVYPSDITTPITIYVDTTAPEATGKMGDESSGQYKVDGAAIEVSILPTDSGVGVDSVQVKVGDNAAVDAVADGGNYKATLSDYTLGNNAGKGTLNVYAIVTDKVGNSSTTSVFQLSVDVEKPVINFTNPGTSGEVTVNKTITVSGNASDNNIVSSVKVEYSKDNSTWTTATTTGNVYNWATEIDTTKYDTDATGLGTLYLRASATDEAGNVSEYATLTLKIDQNEDRPVIKLNNISAAFAEGSATTLRMASTVYGSVSDDDGVVTKVEVSADDGANWIQSGNNTGLVVSSGVFEYTPVGNDGVKTALFRITDSKGAVFTAGGNTLESPYFYGEAENINATGKIYFKVDTTNPEFGDDMKIIGYTDSNYNVAKTEETVLTNSSKLGIDYKYAIISVDVEDDNIVASVFARVDEEEVQFTSADSKTWTGKFDFTDRVDTSRSITIVWTAKDTPGLSATASRTFLYDAKAPNNPSVTTPLTGERVTGAVTIKGTVSDTDESTGVASVKWFIPTIENAGTVDEDTEGWSENVMIGSSGFEIDFTEPDTSDPNSIKYPLDEYANGTYGTEVEISGQTSTNIWLVPIYFRIEDNSGNITIYKDYKLELNPDGDRPVVELAYPTNDITLGGNIRVAGIATDNVKVDSVYMQIDTDGDGTFDDDDKTTLAKNYTVVEDISSGEWGILVTGTSNWHININNNGNLYGSAESQEIGLRFKAFDNNGKASLWSDATYFTLDKGAPTITELKLVQFEDNNDSNNDSNSTIVAEVPYTDDMWIRGKWWLYATVTDNEYLTSVSVDNEDAQGLNFAGWEGTSEEPITIVIPIDTVNDYSSGLSSISSTIIIKDATIESKRSIFINYDNTAPSIGDIKHGDALIGTDGEGESKIVQSNGAFEINTVVTEEHSGFDRLYYYFMRETKDGKSKRIYDPVVDDVDGQNQSRVYFTDEYGNFKEDYSFDSDNIPRFTKEVIRNSTTTVEYDGLGSNKFIRVGSMVKLGGVDRKIVAIDGDVATINTEVDVTHKIAAFAYTLVVDHVLKETPEWKDGKITDISNDDGDKLAESIERAGTNYACGMYINSHNIVDGTIKLYYAAYDKAGNVSKGFVESSVENNGPRLTKVFLGTDLNGDGNVEKTANSNEVIEYSLTTSTKGISVATLDVTEKNQTDSDGNIIPIFTAKDKTTVKPEIVGGNGALYYYLKAKNGDSFDEVANHQKVELRSTESGGVTAVELTSDMLKNYELEGSEFTPQEFEFTIWDSTEEGIIGSSTLYATLNTTFNIDVKDGIEPKVQINQLYWNSEKDNSLYGNSRENGHIDLKDDMGGGNDKVSGKIVIRGTASDDKRLGNLMMYIDSYGMGNTFVGSNKNAAKTAVVTAATYANGVWTPNIPGFSVTDKGIDQDGHRVNWEYVWDSSLIENVAQNNINIHVSVNDTNPANTVAATDYAVDVVPYITKIERTATTNSNTTMNRSTYGEYPIAVGDTIKVTGFNLGTAFKVGNTGVTGTATTATKVYTLSGITNSGELTVTVNGVTNINASNNNSKAYNQDVDNAKWFDNRYLRVWDVDHYFSDSTGGNMPTMIADKKGNLFSSWTLMGSATVQLQRNLKNGTQKPSYAGYDQPDKITAFAVDKSKDNGDLSVLFLPANVGNGGKVTNIGYANGKNVGGAWGQGISNDLSSISTSFGTNKSVTISSNPTHAIDGTTWVAGFQLASYAMGREVSTFETPRTARYGDKLHYAWYDARNKSLKYSFIDMANYGLNTADNAYRYNVDGWTVIDGTSTGIDRVHAKVVNGKDTITTSTDIFSVGSDVIDGDGNDGDRDFSRLTATVNAATVNENKEKTQSCTVKLNSNKALNEATDVSIAIMYTDDVGNFCYDLHDVTSEYDEDNKVYTFSWDTTKSCETPLVYVYLKDDKGNVTKKLTRYTVAIYFGARNVVSSKSSSAGKYSSLDVTKTGKPVLVYYDGDNETLRVAYCTVNTNCNLASNWRICETGVSGGTYVQAKIDPEDNYLHIMYRDSNGQLCYIKSSNNPDGGAYTFGKPMVIETSGTYGTLSLMEVVTKVVTNDGTEDVTNYVPCVAFLNSEGTANGVKYALLRDVDTSAKGIGKTESLWDTMIVPAVVSGGNHYVTGGELVYVEGKSGSWEIEDDGVNTADCDAIVGFNTGRMDVVFLKSETVEDEE